jgi:hypothetical protein
MRGFGSLTGHSAQPLEERRLHFSRVRVDTHSQSGRQRDCQSQSSCSFHVISSEVIKAARDELIRQAAQGEVLHNDDTSMRVLRLAREPSDDRTGVFTSGIVSTQQASTSDLAKSCNIGLPTHFETSIVLETNGNVVEEHGGGFLVPEVWLALHSWRMAGWG